MQSFASPPPPPPHPIIPHTPPQSPTTNHTPQFTPRPHKKGRNYRLYPRPFYPKNHRKGATIAHTHALSIPKTTERAQLSLHLKKNL